MKKEIEIEIPLIPNYIRHKGGNGVVPIGVFSDKELEGIGREWTIKLVEKARLKRMSYKKI
jgi:hypothetical protein